MNFCHDVEGVPGAIEIISLLSCCHGSRDLLHIKMKNGDIPKNDCFTLNHDISAK